MKLRNVIMLLMACSVLATPIWGQTKDQQSRIAVCDNLSRTGQLEAALNCYLQSLESDRQNPTANLRVCQLLEAMGKVDQMKPYFSRIDTMSKEAQSFLELVSSNYGSLDVTCEGPVACRYFFKGKTALRFVPPEDLEPGKASRLTAINDGFKNNGQLWFQKRSPESSVSKIDFFPVVIGAPMPYSVEIAGKSYSFDFNFLQREALTMQSSDLDSIACIIPDSLAEVQVEIDDPDFSATLASAADSSRIEEDSGRYYVSHGQMPTLQFEKKGRTIINKKYLVITSLVLASAVILFQR